MKYIFIILAIFATAFSFFQIASAVSITVPSAPSSGYLLLSTTTGAWTAVSSTTLNFSAASSTLLSDNNTFTGANRFNGGTLITASSTIGNGTQAGGLTINGGATSTGALLVGNTFSNMGPTSAGYINASGGVFSNGTFSIPGLTELGNHNLYTSTNFTLQGYNGSVRTTMFEQHGAGTTALGADFPQGNTGFGTTTPWGLVSLQPATAASTSPQFVVWVSGSSTPSFIVSSANNNGNVGIATSSPNSPLTVNGNSTLAGNVTIGTGIQPTTHVLEINGDFQLDGGGLKKIAMNNTGGNGFINIFTSGSVNNVNLAASGASYFLGGNLGVGTSTPWGLLSVAGLTSNTAPLFVVSSSTPSATTTSFMVANSGHIYASSTVPTLSGCGTTPILNGDDTHGYVTVGATATGCTITFQIAYSAKPECTVTEETGSVVNIFSYVPSATNIVITQTGLGGNVVHYNCEGLTGSK